MSSRLTLTILRGCLLVAAVSVAAQTAAPDVKGTIDRLSAFDCPMRTNAARMLRRAAPAQVVPALTRAVRDPADRGVVEVKVW